MLRSKWLLKTALVGTLAMGFHAASHSSAIAQGVPVVDTQNIAQNIQQLRQMIEDEILQNERYHRDHRSHQERGLFWPVRVGRRRNRNPDGPRSG